MTEHFGRLKTALADRYAIERELGRGGMATVYLAVDSKHARKVAIKVLHPELAASLGPDRFLREIEIAARLQHPHILPLYDSGSSDGFLYYVMPYVEGKSVRAKLAQDGELPIAEAVRILREVVDALSYAHAQGVVHRDIKPDNVLLSGRHALVTDFGVAKAVSEATGRQHHTTAGIALGTPAYMAPEQAAGDTQLDHRVDIYAVGAMAYELLTGRTVFNAPTAQGILAAHVTERAEPVTRHRETIPPILAELVMKCLSKKPADRWQTADEMLPHLESLTTPSAGITPTNTRPLPAVMAKLQTRPTLLTVSAVVVLLAIGLAWVAGRRTPVTMALGRNVQLTNLPGLELDPAISPDGKFIAYSAGPVPRMHIFVRQIDGGRPLDLTDGLPGSSRSPKWDPDGKRIMFVTTELEKATIHVVPAFGGAPTRVLEVRATSAATDVRSPIWSPDGQTIAYARGPAIYRRPLEGGEETRLEETVDPHSLSWSPDGKWIAYVSGNSAFILPPKSNAAAGVIGNIGPSALRIVAAAGGSSVDVEPPRYLHLSPIWTSDGRSLLFISDRDGTRDIYQVQISRSGKPSSDPVRLTTGLTAQALSASSAGSTIVYSVFRNRANIWWIPIPPGRSVSAREAKSLTAENALFESLNMSPDGTWLAFSATRGGVASIYKIPASGGELQRVTSDQADAFAPSWSPDGTQFAFHSTRAGNRDVYTISTEGGPAEPVTTDPRQERRAFWSPDGKSLVFARETGDRADLFIISRSASSSSWDTTRQLTNDGGDVPKWSPGGDLIGYVWAGALKVISPDGSQVRELVRGTGSAQNPVPVQLSWARDGRTIFYAARDLEGRGSLWSIPAAGGSATLLVMFDDPAKQFYRDFTTDGKVFFFNVGDQESDIWSVDAKPRP